MIRALIFDFNGVLADDDPIHMEAFRRVAEEEGLAFTDEEYLDKYLPLNDWDCFKTLYAGHSLSLPAGDLDELIRRKGVYYFQAIAERSVMFAEADRAVRAAAARFPLAIASGARGEEIRHILDLANLEKCFRAIVSAEDVRFGKPHPEPFLRAYEKLKETERLLNAYDCVAIEDSIGGIQSAHQAGMRCLAVAHSYGRDRLDSAGPEWVIDSIADFTAWLEREV
ncbi:MAG TPA: HAD family phosphatase [Terriglobia bacterium]|nr:HAD family phosphatase [Terriglobia bacterium]